MLFVKNTIIVIRSVGRAAMLVFLVDHREKANTGKSSSLFAKSSRRKNH